MKVLILIISLSEPAVMAAAIPEYCAPLVQVQTRAPYCEENVEFLKAAQGCLQKFDAEILVYQGALAAGFAARGAASHAAQDSKFENHDGNLGATAASLEAIITDGQKARSELVVYLDALRYPGDPMPLLLIRKKLAGYLSAFPCYHDRREALISWIGALDKRIGDLQHARGADLALLHQSGTDLNVLGVGGLEPAGAVKHTYGQGSGALPAGSLPNVESTVTGKAHVEKLP